jgi:cAMP-dependent protein kinase regulator
LALLYNCPRAASVIAIQPSICWSLDRQTFTHIVKDAAQRRRAQYDQFIASVSLLQDLQASERHQLVDVLKPEHFFRGDYVVHQGHTGDKFYILEEGSATAEKDTPEGLQKVKDYVVGDYFGELALLRDAPRAASVKVTSEKARVLSLDRHAFDALLGPLREKMDGYATSYK